MPPPRAVSCQLCGQQFFKASLPFHMKQCAVKTAAVPVPCPGCGVEFPQGELSSHMMKCPKCKAMSGLKRSGSSGSNAKGGSLRLPPSGGQSAGSSRQLLGDERVARSRPPTYDNLDVDERNKPHPALPPMEGGRIPCQFCGRKFALDRIAVHSNICKKTNQNSTRRGTFNSTKQRLEGVVEQVGGAFSRKFGGSAARISAAQQRDRTMAGGDSRTQIKPNIGQGERTYTNWREKRNDLISGLRAARQYKMSSKPGGGSMVGSYDYEPTVPAAPPSHYVQCQHCRRNFDPSVAERHIPKCKTTRARPAPPPAEARRSMQRHPSLPSQPVLKSAVTEHYSSADKSRHRDALGVNRPNTIHMHNQSGSKPWSRSSPRTISVPDSRFGGSDLRKSGIRITDIRTSRSGMSGSGGRDAIARADFGSGGFSMSNETSRDNPLFRGF